MNTLFTHIANDTLTEGILMSLIVEGCDMDAVNKKFKTTPLIYAYKQKKNNMVTFLLENGADVSVADANDNTIIDFAREQNNVAVLLMLMKHKARCNAIKLEKIQKNPEKYDEESKLLIRSEAKALDNIHKCRGCSEELDILKSIKTILTTDSILQKYPQLCILVGSITKFEYLTDLTGGNADDKSEAATIELAIAEEKHHLEYFYWYNWSYGESRLMLVWRHGEKVQRIWDIEEKEQQAVSDDQKKVLYSLAKALLGLEGSCDVPLEDFVRFLIVLLSRMVQKKWLELEDHGIYLRFSAS